MLRICGHRVKVAELRESVGLPFPDATGQRIYTANGIYSNRAEYLGHAIPGCLLVPSVNGPFFLCFPGSDSPNNRTFDQKPVISVFADDPGHGLAGLDHLPEQFLHVDAHVDAKVYVNPWVYHVAKAERRGDACDFQGRRHPATAKARRRGATRQAAELSLPRVVASGDCAAG